MNGLIDCGSISLCTGITHQRVQILISATIQMFLVLFELFWFHTLSLLQKLAFTQYVCSLLVTVCMTRIQSEINESHLKSNNLFCNMFLPMIYWTALFRSRCPHSSYSYFMIIDISKFYDYDFQLVVSLYLLN